MIDALCTLIPFFYRFQTDVFVEFIICVCVCVCINAYTAYNIMLIKRSNVYVPVCRDIDRL